MPVKSLVANLEQLKANEKFVVGSLGDMSEEENLQRLIGAKKNSHAFLAGHMLKGRWVLAQILGHKEEFPFEEQFGWRESVTDGENYPSQSELAEKWEYISAIVYEAFEKKTDEELAEEKEWGMPFGQKNALGEITFFVFHETWHLGQISTIRSEMGLEGLRKFTK